MAQTKRKSVTLDDLRPKTQRMYVVHPGTGEETTAYFDVIGQDSKEVRKVFTEIVRERNKDKKEPTYDDLQDENVRILAATVKGWDENTFGTFTEDNVRTILNDPELTPVREQLNNFTEDRRNFFRQSSS